MHFLGLHGSSWYQHTAASAYFFKGISPASEGFRHLPAGIEYGVLEVYSDLTALLDCLIQCLFSYNFHYKPKKWCIDYPRHSLNRDPKHFFSSCHSSDTILLATSASTFCLILSDCSVCEISSYQISPSLQNL